MRGMVVETIVLFPGRRDAVDLVEGVVGLGFGDFRLAAVLVDRFWAVVVVVDVVFDSGVAEVVRGVSEGLVGGIAVVLGGRPRLRVIEVAVFMVEFIV